MATIEGKASCSPECLSTIFVSTSLGRLLKPSMPSGITVHGESSVASYEVEAIASRIVTGRPACLYPASILVTGFEIELAENCNREDY